ncbi:aspartate kinase [Pseudonocardia cypriaca]|uniref:Aspartokinase n=1 Tax=Pseudonocardia cypriaca TaxID=882449 RepID=A0A543GES0_9PSEU|nr:aspartate kinase [Pseudonocardia cypriaca]TQM44564.1 aspartate kinase [Pseudonocardia cypriaca]
MGAQPLLVWKFGGMSLSDLTRLRAAAQRMVAARRAGHQLVTVLSAMGSSTDELNAMAYSLSARPQLRELDALLSVGENISCALAAIAVQDAGERAISLTGPQAGILTDGSHGNAQLWDVRPKRVLEELDAGAIVLVTGYQGLSPEGDLTTLGRGGSDASAVAMAAALGLHECEIFTDVPAVFSADPRVVPDARRLAAISRDEMLQLAAAGAAVLQPRAVELAAAHDIDIHVRSSFTTETGTWIQEEAVFETFEITGVAHRDREALYTVTGASLAMITLALAQRGAAVGAIVRDGSAIHLTVPGVEEPAVLEAVSTVGARIVLQDELGSVSVVGSGIGRRPDATARALLELEAVGIETQLVTSTPSRVTFHVAGDAVHRAARRLHTAFGLHRAAGVEPGPDRVARSVS